MAKREVFVLLKKPTFRHTVKLYLKGADGKIDQRNLKFTTEHKINEKERGRNAKLVAAEFFTDDPKIIDAIYRDTGYGKTFTHVDDPEFKRKRDPFVVTPMDARKIALRNLFVAIDLNFDESKSTDVLTEEYQIHIAAKTGIKLDKGGATDIPHKPIDVHQDILDVASSARKLYEDKYGEPVPSAYANDLSFLSALSDPNWDAKAYIDEMSASDEAEEGKGNGIDHEVNDLPDTAEELGKIYFDEFGVNVANPMKNNVDWMKNKILGNRSK